MNAIVTRKYGGPEVLQLENVAVPVPKDNEILVRVHATSVTAAQMSIRTGKPYIGRLFMGLLKPNNLIGGTDFSGEVLSVGKHVTNFNIGDNVYGATDVAGGTYAEYAVMSEDDVVLTKPSNVTHEEAAAIIEGSSTAYAFLNGTIQLQSGQSILINGASGSIGTAAVQIAKEMGATVTAVCSTKNMQMVRSLGADHVIDYTQEDFTQSAQKYDVIFDTVGKLSFMQSRRALTAQGVFLSPVPRLSDLWNMLLTSRSKGQRLLFAATGLRNNDEKKYDFKILRDLLSQGKLDAVIDRIYQLPQAAEAHRYVEKGHKKGNVVLVIEN